ncbi:hypothetical protein PRZ48_001850 [Zasmidium cellare]|uniref:Uncharacterized protein n=1 Tax=Zasmidium cellare TaxID=395010 RepID=A0ABR0F2L7_ZASCE|nr:hypothetical protein PRZ48_001850 [Zasmidium cellare]
MSAMDLATHFTFGFILFRKLLPALRRSKVSEPARDHGTQPQAVTYHDAATQTEWVDQATEDNQHQPPQDPIDASPEPEYDDIAQDEVIDEQALRDETYVAFEEVAEDDFTAGPARFIVASDGVKDCAALLSTMDLTNKVRTAIEARRNYDLEERKAIDEQTALMNLEGDVDIEISNHECRILENDDDPETIEALQKELDNLRLMAEDVKFRRECVEAQMLTQTMVLRNCQTAALQVLEEAFMASALCDPPTDQQDTNTPQTMDLQQEYQAFCNRQQETDEPQDIEPLDITPDEYFQANNDHLTPSELAKYEVRDNYFATQDQLIAAQNRFDRRELDREKDRQTTDQSPEAFDIHWVHRFRELTTQLIAAEAAFTAAKVAANEAGIDIGGEDQCSMFLDRDDDGYRESHDAACTASAPRDKILQWVDGISDEADPGELCGDVEVDEWDAPEMDLSDSVSCVAVGSWRSKIDQWNS